MSASRKSSSASSPPGPPPYEAQLDKETHIRLLAEKEDFQRRIKERDARSTELQKTADAAEKKAQKAAETLAVERAERELLAAQVADREKTMKGEISDLEKRLREASARADRSDGSIEALQSQLDSAASLQRETRLELVETQRQLAEARAAIARAEGEADDLRTAGDRQNKSSSQSHGALSRERDALRADVNRLEQGLSAARAEVKCGEATASMLLQQLELARSTLGGQRDLAQQRADDAIATREEERLGREKAEEAAAVANAACVIRREEGERTQEALVHERATTQSLLRELEALRSEAGAARRRADALEKERVSAEAHATKLAASVAHEQATNARLERERTLLISACSRHEAYWRVEASDVAAGSPRGKDVDALHEWSLISQMLGRIGVNVAPLPHGRVPLKPPPAGPTLTPPRRAGLEVAAALAKTPELF